MSDLRPQQCLELGFYIATSDETYSTAANDHSAKELPFCHCPWILGFFHRGLHLRVFLKSESILS
jgi:hypothetical protein